MYVMVGEGVGGGGWRAGAVEPAVVESIDLMVTIADRAPAALSSTAHCVPCSPPPPPPPPARSTRRRAVAGIPLPHQALGGETLRPFLVAPAPAAAAAAAVAVVAAPRKKAWALSQWPRRPSCTVNHGCLDGHGSLSHCRPLPLTWTLAACEPHPWVPNAHPVTAARRCPGNPYELEPDQAVMGYKLRTNEWAYVCWFSFGNFSNFRISVQRR